MSELEGDEATGTPGPFARAGVGSIIKTGKAGWCEFPMALCMRNGNELNPSHFLNPPKWGFSLIWSFSKGEKTPDSGASSSPGPFPKGSMASDGGLVQPLKDLSGQDTLVTNQGQQSPGVNVKLL